MSIATKLIEESWDFAQRNPEHKASMARLVECVVRIERKFEGEERDRLLIEASTDFRRQLETLEKVARNRETLEQLREKQRQLKESLMRIALEQPEDGEAWRPSRSNRASLH